MLMKKDFINLRRSRWLLLSLFALFVGVSPTWADEVTVYDGTVSNDYLPVYGYYADSQGTISEYIIPSSDLSELNGKEIEKMIFYLHTPAAASWGAASFNVYLEEVSGSNYDDSSASQLTDSKTLVYAGALDGTGSTMEIPFSSNYSYNGGNLLVAIEVGTKGTYKTAKFLGSSTTQNAGRYKYSSTSGRAKFIPKTTFVTPTNGPALTVKDGSKKLTSPCNYDFGLATAGTTHEFKLTNPGTAAVEGLSVSETGSFGATLSATTIAVGGEATLTITMPAATGSSTITISSTTEGIDDFVINASGTIRDASKLYEYGFTSLPTDWTTTGASWYYSETNGAYTTTWYLSNNHRLITPLLTVEEGETFFVEAKGYSTSNTSYQHLQMQYSADGTTWTNFDSEPTLDPSNWNKFTFTGVPAGKYYIAINASQADVRMFYGGKLPDGAKFAIDTDGTAQDYGMVMKDASAIKTFTVTNNGNVALEVTFAPSAGFSTPASLNVAAGASETFNVVMNTTTPGAKSGNVVLSFTATNATEFTIPVTGYVADPDKIYADFNDNQLPTGWSDNTGWTFSDGKAVAGTDTQMTLPALTVAEGEKLAISVMGTGSFNELYYYTSTDGGTSWSAKSTNLASSISTSAYSVVYIEGLAAGNYKLKLQGYQVKIDAINGFTLNADAPALTVDPTTDAAFGKVKAQPAAKTYTITNSGTGTLTGTITSSDIEKFTVSENSFSLGAGENMTFEVNLVFDENYGEKAANITIHPTNDGLTDVVINATATTADPNVWDEDFESGSMPEFWVNEGAWTVSTPSASGNNGTKMATISSYNNPKSLTTPRLQANAGDKLTFYIGMQYDDEPLTIEYQKEGESTWNTIEDGVANYTASAALTFTAPSAGYYYIRFTGTYAMLDNFLGFKLNVPEHIASITGSYIPTSGLKATRNFDATVTVKESRGVAEELTAKLYMDGAEIGSVAGNVAANGSVTLTIPCTPTVAGVDAEMYIEVVYAGGTLRTETVNRTVDELVRLELDDDTNVDVVVGEYDVITLERNFAAGWNTFIAPLPVNTSEFGVGAKVYAFTGYADKVLSFSPLAGNTTVGATPYIVYVPAAIDSKTFTWEDASIGSAFVGEEYIRTTINSVVFQGTYAPIAAGGLEGKYGVTADGRIAPASSIASLKGFRAYFDDVPADARIALFGEDDVPTGIRFIDCAAERSAEGVYNLNGQRVQNVKKGLYIQNGRKVVIK